MTQTTPTPELPVPTPTNATAAGLVYRKKPVVIEAVRFDGNELVDDCLAPMFEGSFVAPDWIVDAMAKHENEAGACWPVDEYLIIHTLEGNHQAWPGDWIIRGVKGELYPVKDEIFRLTYDPVGDHES